jgi:uncharacterized delta-60 repeat protein
MRNKFWTILLICYVLIGYTVVAQPGTLDLTFNPVDVGHGMGDGSNSYIYTTALKNNGKILIGGAFISYNGFEARAIAQLNSNGSLDSSFNPEVNNHIRCIAIQMDGKVIIGGLFTSVSGIPRNRIARLNEDGSLDTTFNPGTGANGTVYTITVQTDGQVIIGGFFTSINGTARNHIARLNVDGSLDGSFNPGTGSNNNYVYTTTIQADGKLIIGGDFTSVNGTPFNYLARLNTDGSVDMSFNIGTGANNKVFTSVIQGDGKILIGGIFTFFNGSSRNRIVRINSDGSLDLTFNPGNGANGDIATIGIQGNGRIVVGGDFSAINGTSRSRIARLLSDGTLDTSFNPGTGASAPGAGSKDVLTIVIQIDGKIIIGGYFNTYNGTRRNYLTRLNNNGSIDDGFNIGTGADYTVLEIKVQRDSTIIIGGAFTSFNGTLLNYLARLDIDGNVDVNFNSNLNGNVSEIVTQPDGRIIIGGNFTSINGIARNSIARLNTDGTLDNSFIPGTGANLQVFAIATQVDGKIFIGGNFTSFNGTARSRIARLNIDGTLDVSFNPGTGANGNVNVISVQDDGKVILGGDFTLFNGVSANRLVRINSDGTVDGSFNLGSGANGSVSSIKILSNGKTVVAGSFTAINGMVRRRIARFNNDGALDSTFNPGNGPNGMVLTLSIQDNGKIIIGGQFPTFDGVNVNYIARLNEDGSFDSSFNSGTGAESGILASDVQADGKILIGGYFTSYNGIGKNRITRLNGDVPSNVSHQYFPAISLSSASVIAGTSITINGENFTANSSSQINISNSTGYLQAMNTSINPNGTFALSFSTTNFSSDYYSVSVKDISTNKTISKTFYVSSALPTSLKYLKILSPTAGSNQIVGQNIRLEWTDKMINSANFPLVPNSSQRNYKYHLEYQSNGGAWNFVKTITGKALLNSTITLFDYFSINTVGSNFLVRITDGYDQTIKDTSSVFSCSTTANSNIQVNLLWDYSFPISYPLLVQGVAADGASRIYLQVNKINSNIGSAIASVSVSLSDGFNTSTSKLGKVMVATNTNTYSDEANIANSINAINNSILSNYYFWYVAPDDFVGGNPNDAYGSSRNVLATFTITFVNDPPIVVTRSLEIVRPPLMLVHGLGGDEGSWRRFQHDGTLNSPVKKFIDDESFKFKKSIKIYPSASFDINAFQITNGGTGSGFGFGNSFQGVLSSMRALGYAANRVDYVCHSMGGAVLRKVLDQYSNNFFVNAGSESYNNYGKGFVNKAITIDSPHNGSPFADLMIKYLPSANILIRKVAVNVLKYFTQNNGVILPTGAISNLQANQLEGGVAFNAFNVKAHLIAGDVFDDTYTTLNTDVWNKYSQYSFNDYIVGGIFDAAMNIESDPLRLAALLVIKNESSSNEERAVKFLDLYMTWNGYDEFVLNSDFVVPLSSQIAGLNSTSPLVSIFNSPNTNLFHSNAPVLDGDRYVLNNLDIGTRVFDLLNTDISNPAFGGIPATPIQSSFFSQHSALSTSSIPELYYDTTKIKIIDPVPNSLILADSLIKVLIQVKDTVNLSHITLYFMGRSYFSSIVNTDYEFSIQASGEFIGDNTILVQSIYKYPENVNSYFDSVSVNVYSTQTCRSFAVQPEVMKLLVHESKVPAYEGVYDSFISNLSNCKEISVVIDNNLIVEFNIADNSFTGVSQGETFAVLTYQNLSDTIYFLVEGDTSASTASFSSNKKDVCQGSEVSYHNVSSGDYLSIQWEFEGGYPSTSSLQNPIVTYDSLGTFAVSLITTYPNKTDTLTIPNYLSVNSCPVSLNIKTFIEGFYLGGGQMAASVDLLNQPRLCDTISIELRNEAETNIIAYSVTGVVDIYGEGEFVFPPEVQGKSFYIVLHHRNALETWSSSPVLLKGPITNYNFSDALSKAFDNNMRDLGDGNFAIYSGDINQDGEINQADFSSFENISHLLLIGYLPEDLTGDGLIESSDYSLIENNLGKIVMRPQ